VGTSAVAAGAESLPLPGARIKRPVCQADTQSAALPPASKDAQGKRPTVASPPAYSPGFALLFAPALALIRQHSQPSSSHRHLSETDGSKRIGRGTLAGQPRTMRNHNTTDSGQWANGQTPLSFCPIPWS